LVLATQNLGGITGRSTDMTQVNSVGDLVLTDTKAMRALADPVRLALLDRLRREGPATAAELSSSLQAGDTEGHLEALERFGLVTRQKNRWSAVAKGFVFEIPDDPEGQAAARKLSRVMMLNYVDLPRRWVADDEPRLTLDWARAAGLFNARLTVTPDELRGLQEGLERLIEPLITREADDGPDDAGRVRILAYFLPEA
jgi:DNA-binding transcriptional ArsR family regulator